MQIKNTLGLDQMILKSLTAYLVERGVVDATSRAQSNLVAARTVVLEALGASDPCTDDGLTGLYNGFKALKLWSADNV